MNLPAGLRRTLGALAIACCAGSAAQAQNYSGLFVFGDSLSDVGNDFLISGGAIPVGAIYTDGGTTGRFTNGRNYADHLAGALGLGLTPSVLGGNNYAYGGARVGGVPPELAPLGALSFNQQLGAYLGTNPSAQNDSLFVLWIGANDMSDAIAAAAAGDTSAIPQAIGSVMTSLGGAIQGLASRGAQHFLVPNLPDLSLTPAVNGIGNPALSALARAASEAFNTSLSGLLAAPSFAGLDIVGLDVYAAQSAITANPSVFGFDNVTTACYNGYVNGQPLPGGGTPTICGNPAGYMYWDYEHPSAALHAQLGQLAVTAVVPEPAAALLMALGLGAVGISRRRAAATA